MLNWIKSLLGIHVHQWTSWEISRCFIAEKIGHVKVVQSRRCTQCGKHELHMDFLG